MSARKQETILIAREALNGFLDKLSSAEIRVLQWRHSAFRVCGYAGVMMAIFLAIGLITYLHLSVWVMAAVIVSAMMTFLALTMINKIITGDENIIYYHHEIAVIIVAALLLKLLHQPVLPYLDVMILGVGIFLVCGRVGCLMVGCCHGLPHRWGVRYRQEHMEAGFTHYFVGVRLFPIQAVESLCALFIVIVGIALILNGYAPGEAFAWYVGVYALVRFCLEFMRGDPERPYLFGFSEAQWTSLILMCAVVWAESNGTIPFHQWHLAATAWLALMMAAIALARRFRATAKHKLINPRHIREVAQALEALYSLTNETAPISRWDPRPSSIRIMRTSLGIRLSMSKIMTVGGFTYNYSFSSESKLMAEEAAAILANLILLLRHPVDSSEFVRGDRGVFHLLINPPQQARGRQTMILNQAVEASDYGI